MRALTDDPSGAIGAASIGSRRSRVPGELSLNANREFFLEILC
jgi:hypothetical protein